MTNSLRNLVTFLVRKTLKLNIALLVVIMMVVIFVYNYFRSDIDCEVPDITDNSTIDAFWPNRTVAEYLTNDASRFNDTDREPEYKICPHLGDGIMIAFFVLSSPSNVSARNAIRRTWGSFSQRNDIIIAFIIGITENEEENNQLNDEQRVYGDLIRGEFLDSYNNLTLKTTWMLKWVKQYCPNAVYTFKIDDDVFVNVDLLLEFIEKKKIIPGRVMYGHLAVNWKPVRNRNCKNYITTDQFKPKVFPNFVTGPAYMFSTALSEELYSTALNFTYMNLEDVFYSGIVAEKLNISRTDIPEFTNQWLRDCTLKTKITIHRLVSEQLSYAWYLLNAKCKKS